MSELFDTSHLNQLPLDALDAICGCTVDWRKFDKIANEEDGGGEPLTQDGLFTPQHPGSLAV